MKTTKRFFFILIIGVLFLSACSASQTTTTPVLPTDALEEEPTQVIEATEELIDLDQIEHNIDYPVSDTNGNMICEVVPGFLSPDSEEGKKNYEVIGYVNALDTVKGPEDAKLTIIEYSEFQCPYCKGAFYEVEKFRAAYPDDVRVVYRHLPLSSIHPNADLASRAAESAGNQGKFWEMADLLFSNQSEWSSLDNTSFQTWLEEQAKLLELDVDQFKLDLTSEEIIKEVADSFQKATSVGLSSVPTLFINGIFVGNMDFYGLLNMMKIYEHDARVYKECPPFIIDTSKSYTATIETEKGDIVLELFADKAPLAVNSFVFLAREGYFNGITFHRVISDFMAQAGDPTGTGWADPGYQFMDEIVEGLDFDRPGLLAMANAGANTNGSQFFITYADTPDLNGSYTIFGLLIEGMDVLNSITERNPQTNPGAPEGDLIISIRIDEK